jgi:N-acetyl-anhydromuramyl-L-alanine amidase AmpD
MVEASDPFLGVNRLSRDGFVSALASRTHNPGLEEERELGEYWQECIDYGVDSSFALSMFIHESSCGTAGSSMETFSWGNTRSPSFGSVPYDLIAGRSGSFPAFGSWLEGLRSTVARLSSMVWPVGAPYGERTSILEVFDHPSGSVWAPSSDLNDPNSYLSSMLSSMNQYADCEEWIVQTAVVVPPVYSSYLTTNFSYGRGGRSVRAFCLHVTQGASASSAIGWFSNPTSKVSSTYVIDRNGDIYAVVREGDTAWANGILKAADTDIPIIDTWVAEGVNPNSETISLEIAGYSSMEPAGQPAHLVGYSPEQFDALAYLLPVLSARHGVPIDPDHVFGHDAINSIDKVNCPGLSDEEWQRVYSMGTPTELEGPYATADDAYDAYCREQQDVVIWAGEIRDKGHWTGRNPQEVSRTGSSRLLAYDGGYALDASGFMMDEWEEASWSSGQLTIWGKEPPPTPVTPAPPDPAPGPIVVGAAWPVNPGDGATDVATGVTLQWGSDAPTSDVEFDQSDGVRIFALQAHTSTAYGPLTLAEATTYVWRVRGRDSGNVSDWTEARFGTTAQTPVGGGGTDEEKPPKPPSTEPYPPVVTPTHAEQPAAITWANVKSGRTDLAVSEKWRPDGAAGSGDWPDTAQHTDPSYPGRHDPDPSWLDIRKLTRRLSMMPAISEALLRAGAFERVPAREDPCSRDWWAEGASEDWGDDCDDLPEHVRVWASRICTLGLALGAQPTVWQALTSLGFAEQDAHEIAGSYHCLRRRCRSMEETNHC